MEEDVHIHSPKTKSQSKSKSIANVFTHKRSPTRVEHDDEHDRKDLLDNNNRISEKFSIKKMGLVNNSRKNISWCCSNASESKSNSKSPSASLVRSPSNVSDRPLDIPLRSRPKNGVLSPTKRAKSTDAKWQAEIALNDSIIVQSKRTSAESRFTTVHSAPSNDKRCINRQTDEQKTHDKDCPAMTKTTTVNSLDKSHIKDLKDNRPSSLIDLNGQSSVDESSARVSSPESTRSMPESTVNRRRSMSQDTASIKTEPRSRSTVGMDSLARQALLAAQVLHLIPTHKARERNFLHGRIAVNSLLGANELERVLPNREMRIFVGTWNMNGQMPPKELNDFVLPTCLDHVPDVLAIGSQESTSERFEWEVCLQETIGPSHVMLHSACLGTLHLAIFIRRDLIWFCSICEEASLSVRPGTAFRTKGAVGIAFMIFGTSYLFVTAHLTAHQEKVKERVSDIKRIIRSLELPKNLPVRHKSKGKRDVTQNFDYVFWFGDLNFRLAESRDQVLNWIEHTRWPLPAHLPHGMMHTDQLQTVLADGAAFKGFREAKITFAPTYKYDPGTQRFDSSSKQRTPAYTDRILYKFRSVPMPTTRRASAQSTQSECKVPLECLVYDSVPSMMMSDHKPVWGVFRSVVRPGIDTIPLAAGLFNRDVYLEGIKRRAANLEKRHANMGVCSVQ